MDSKVWIGIAVTAAAAAGIYFYVKSKNQNQAAPVIPAADAGAKSGPSVAEGSSTAKFVQQINNAGTTTFRDAVNSGLIVRSTEPRVLTDTQKSILSSAGLTIFSEPVKSTTTTTATTTTATPVKTVTQPVKTGTVQGLFGTHI